MRSELLPQAIATLVEPTAKDGPAFEVVTVVGGCKYFVEEQGDNYSLVEDWLCSRSRKGDTGVWKRELLWLLGKSRALEKMAEKGR